MRTLIAVLSLALGASAYGQTPNNARMRDTLNVGVILIAVDNSGRTDPSLGGLDSTLRGVLRFTGYRGLGGGGSLAFPGKTFDLTFFAPDKQRVRVFCTVEQLNKDTNPATAQLRVTLSRVDSATNRPAGPNIFAAGVTIPEDHTVVIGSGMYGETGLAIAVRWRTGPFRKKE
jgi:hypothetical protein